MRSPITECPTPPSLLLATLGTTIKPALGTAWCSSGLVGLCERLEMTTVHILNSAPGATGSRSRDSKYLLLLMLKGLTFAEESRVEFGVRCVFFASLFSFSSVVGHWALVSTDRSHQNGNRLNDVSGCSWLTHLPFEDERTLCVCSCKWVRVRLYKRMDK